MMKLTSWIAGVALASFCAAPAVAGTYYTWTTDDGVVSYSNDAKRIPALYKEKAQRQTVGSLNGYKRYTPAGKAGAGQAERLSSRLEHLREAARPAPQHAYRGHHGRGGSSVTLDFGTVEINDRSHRGAAPLVVDQVRAKDPGHLSTHTVQVIRRGDRVVAVVAGEQNDNNVSFVKSVDQLSR